ncbi:hypothetical protein IEQ34_001775 [Dendrobium chrysotoxum]|uniref:Uncharacterized protein n=1 Tax=Dendrobium chrysotoxum TaxID=161865 RepID=A0AAV7HMT0_DENCH|nr:hypothetical protein IEQ34_001775 [Dendrobium chrysotoxum]
MAEKRLCGLGFLEGPFKTRSFLEALSGISSDVSFPDLKSTSFRELPSLWILEQEILALAAPFQFYLVGFFPSKLPSLEFIQRFFFKLKLICEVLVTLLDSLHILIKPVNDFDYSSVFCHRSYLVYNCYMKLPNGLLYLMPLKVDTATFVGSQPFVACVLVELDITKSYPDKVRLGLEKFGYVHQVVMGM